MVMQKKIYLLILENHPGDANVIWQNFDKLSHDFEVFFVNGVADAEILCRKKEIDLAILDIHKQEDSLSVLRNFAKALPKIPNLVLIAEENDDISIAALKLGAQDVIHKESLSAKAITRIARYAVERSRLAAAIDEQQSEMVQVEKLSAIGTLAAGIAHEINTPIQYIGDNISFLLDAFEDLSQVIIKQQAIIKQILEKKVSRKDLNALESFIEEVEVEYLKSEIPQALNQSQVGIGQAAKVIKSMKEFSHSGSKDKSSIDIAKAIDSTITISRNEWKYNAEIELDLDPTVDTIECYAGELNQVLLNLVVNAAHALGDGEEKGLIRILTKDLGDNVEIRVCDNGPGIPKEIQRKIFNPFFTTKEPGQGTGQGLTISHSIIVDKHGGTLSFSTKEGEGTDFIITLPKKLSEPIQELSA